MINQAINNKQSILIFEHIPKTAGSTLRTILWRVYGGNSVFVLNPVNPIKSPINTDNLVNILNSNHTIKVIVNHAGYGLQNYLPSSCQYKHFVLLREPIERTISYYYHRLRTGKIDANVSLEHYVQSHPRGIWNWQTASLGEIALACNLEEVELIPELFSEDLLNRAKENLRKQMAVGLTECFDESILLFSKVFGWSRLRSLYTRKNVGKRPRRNVSLSPRTLKVLEKHNELDLELYDYGKRLFRQQLEQQHPNLEQELQRFRKMNTAYGKVFPVINPYATQVVHAVRNLLSLS